MELDAAFLSRLQFALTVMFHYLFPPLTIGLGALMVFAEGMYLKTGDKQYESVARFWTRLFAVNFAMGVATGIVLEFQFGTNWSTYARYVGDVFGAALAAEGIFAFFLESGFLAVLVFGWDRVSARMHFFSTVMVFLGSIFSSIWIVVANSWQQTPAGHHIVNGRAEIVDFWAVVFNPSAVHRLVHVWIGALILGAFFVMSVSAYYILKGRHLVIAKKTFPLGLRVGVAASLAILLSGHLQARNVAQHQPAKLAAFEGHYRTGDGGAPLYLFGWPDEKEQRVALGLAVPGMLSFLVHDDFHAPVAGLDRFRPEDRPAGTVLNLAFQGYHLMAGLGMFFIGVTLLGSFFHRRGTLFEKRWLLWVFVFAVAGAFVANEAGWAAAELGRQPWVVYPRFAPPGPGQPLFEAHAGLRTAAAHSPTVPASQILASLVMFAVIYALLFLVWVFILDRKIKQGPEPVPEAPEKTSAAGLMEAAARRGEGTEYSLTEPSDKG
jgi:cytochrome d ubiquinol oxidase subunit I